MRLSNARTVLTAWAAVAGACLLVVACDIDAPAPALSGPDDLHRALADIVDAGGIEGQYVQRPRLRVLLDPEVDVAGPDVYVAQVRADLAAGRFVAPDAELRLVEDVWYVTGTAADLWTRGLDRHTRQAVTAKQGWVAVCLEREGFNDRMLPPVLEAHVTDLVHRGADDQAGVVANTYDATVAVERMDSRWLTEELDPTITVRERLGRIVQVGWSLSVPSSFAGEPPIELDGSLTVSRVTALPRIEAPADIMRRFGACAP